MKNTRQRSQLTLSLAILIAGFSTLLYAQDKDNIPIQDAKHQVAVDKLVEEVSASFKGIAVGLVRQEGDRQIYFETYGFGQTASGGPTPDGNTVFEIGSVSKTFTSLILSKYVLDNKVGLDQRVQELMPAGVKLPASCADLKVEHLSNHMAGFPKMPPSCRAYGEGSYTLPQFYNDLRNLRLTRKPGTQWDYSNYSVGLLGHILTLKDGAIDYETLLKKEVLLPLGMLDTTITLSEDQKSRLAQPHNLNGSPVTIINWASDALIGAGGIRSTVLDMLKFVGAQAGIFNSSLGAAMKKSHIPLVTTTKNARMGLAWFVDDNGFGFHGGKTYGCTSFVGFDPTRKFGVVVLTNNADSDRIGKLGANLLKMMAGIKGEEEPENLETTVDLAGNS